MKNSNPKKCATVPFFLGISLMVGLSAWLFVFALPEMLMPVLPAAAEMQQIDLDGHHRGPGQ